MITPLPPPSKNKTNKKWKQVRGGKNGSKGITRKDPQSLKEEETVTLELHATLRLGHHMMILRRIWPCTWEWCEPSHRRISLGISEGRKLAGEAISRWAWGLWYRVQDRTEGVHFVSPALQEWEEALHHTRASHGGDNGKIKMEWALLRGSLKWSWVLLRNWGLRAQFLKLLLSCWLIAKLCLKSNDKHPRSMTATWTLMDFTSSSLWWPNHLHFSLWKKPIHFNNQHPLFT